MVKRNNRIEIKLTKEELNSLHKKAKKSGLSVGGFIRCAISETEVKEIPPVDLTELIMQVRKVNTQLTEILKLSEQKCEIDADEIKAAIKSNRKMEREIVNIYTIKGEEWQ